MATKFPTKSCVDSHFTAHHRLNRVLYHNPLQLMMVVAQRRKAVPTPIKATTGEQLKVKAVVRVKCDTKEYVKDMMLGWLDSNSHTAHTGVVLQLVSAQVDPKKIIESDSELNAWYHECINVGHADISDASWWPKLSTPNDLISILTTITWLASGHHAAVNFGMYSYGGYVPVRPPYMRRLVPNEDEPDYATFLADPEGYFLASLPCLSEMLHYISVFHVLSAHSGDEEYLGDRKELSAWNGDPEILEAFYKFSMEMKKIGKEIERRNGDPNLRNRCGAGISPYELLLPSSGPGVTCRGVPNSVSI